MKEPISLHFGIWNYRFWTATIFSSFDYDDYIAYDHDFYLVDETIEIDEQSGEEIQIFVFHWNNPYPDAVEVDSYWRASRAFGITSLTFGSILVLNRFYFFLACPKKNRIPGISEMIGSFACSLFQGMSLLIFKSDACDDNYMLKGVKKYFSEKCDWGAGANCAIAAAVFWFLAAICSHPYEATKIHQDLPDEEEGDAEEAPQNEVLPSIALSA